MKCIIDFRVPGLDNTTTSISWCLGADQTTPVDTTGWTLTALGANEGRYILNVPAAEYGSIFEIYEIGNPENYNIGELTLTTTSQSSPVPPSGVITTPTYGDIQSKVAAWLDRADLVARIPDFINIAMSRLEKDYNYGFMEVLLTDTVPSTGYITIPIYYKAPKNMRVSYNGFTIELKQMDWSSLQNLYRNSGYVAAPDKYYAISLNDSRIYFRPLPEPINTYTLDHVYFKYTPPLVNGSEYNTWTVTHWDALLYGALLEASIYLINDERVGLWKAKYDEAVIKIKMADDELELAGSQAVILPTVSFSGMV